MALLLEHFKALFMIQAYRRQNEERFLEVFARTCERLDGVPEKIICDNGKVAVKDGKYELGIY
jgi:transposase